jgi:hypothetical protein
LSLQKTNQVLNHREFRRAVASKFGGSQIRNRGAGRSRDGGNGFVIGRHVHRIDLRTRERLLDRMDNQRLAGEVTNILARQSLAAAAG